MKSDIAGKLSQGASQGSLGSSSTTAHDREFSGLSMHDATLYAACMQRRQREGDQHFFVVINGKEATVYARWARSGAQGRPSMLGAALQPGAKPMEPSTAGPSAMEMPLNPVLAWASLSPAFMRPLPKTI